MNVIFANNQEQYILELNPLTTLNGFSVVKNAGILFQKKINILMEELENHNKKQERVIKVHKKIAKYLK